MDNKMLVAVFEFIAEQYKYQLKFDFENVERYVSSLSFNNNALEYPSHIFKYFGRNKYSLDSLENNYLYFSDPRNFNDPFDCLVNRERFIVANKSNMQKHRDNIGICCFSLIKNNPLMWGHYADCFSGFCFKIKNHFPTKDIAIKSHVAYLNDYDGTNDSLRDTINQVDNLPFNKTEKNIIQSALKINYEYCWKYRDWKYEDEYRMVSINALKFNRKLPIEKTQLEEIYIGYRMKSYYPNYYEKLMKILKQHYPHISIYEVSPHPISVLLEFKEY
jgi:DUF2971 family protein